MIGGLLLLSLTPLLPERFGSSGPSSGSIVKAAARDVFNIEAPVRLSDVPALDLLQGRVTLGDVEGQGARQIVLDGAHFRLQAARAQGDVTPGRFGPEALSPIITQLLGLGIEQVSIRNGSLKVITATGAETVFGSLAAEIDARTGGHVSARGTTVLNGEALTFDVTVDRDAMTPAAVAPATTGAANPADARPARAVAIVVKSERLGEAQLSVMIDAALDMTGSVKARLTAPGTLLGWLGVPVRLQSRMPGLIDLAGTARIGGGQVDLQQAIVSFDGLKPATGALSARFAGPRLLLEGTLAFPSIDATAIAGASEPGGIVTMDVIAERLWQKAAVLFDIDGDLRLSAAAVSVGGVNVGRGAASITSRGGKVRADLADVVWGADKARLNIEADGNVATPAYAIRGRIDVADAKAFTARVTGQPLVAGPLVATVDVTRRGGLPGRHWEALTGRVALTASGTGLRSRIDPVRLAERASIRPRQPAGQSAPVLVQSDFSGFEALDLRLVLGEPFVLIEAGSTVTAGGRSVPVSGRIERNTSALDVTIGRPTAVRAGDAKGPRPTDVPADSALHVRGVWPQPVVVRADAASPLP